MSEFDQWGRTNANDIAKRVIELATSKLPMGLGTIVDLVLFPGGGGDALNAFTALKTELATISAHMNDALTAVQMIAEQIQWTQHVLEAQPAADRIMAKFAALRSLGLDDKRLAQQLVDDTLDPNQGVAVDLLTVHSVITGVNPVDPGQVSLVEAWTEKVRDNPNLAQGVAWVNTYFTCLVQIQLQGLILLVNALHAEQADGLAQAATLTLATRLQQQLDMVHGIDIAPTRHLTLPKPVDFVIDGAPILDDGKQTWLAVPLVRFLPGSFEIDSLQAISSAKTLDGSTALDAVSIANPGVNIASFGDRFYVAGYREGHAVIRSPDSTGTWTTRLDLPAAAPNTAIPLLSYAGTLHIAIDGMMATSPDGAQWHTTAIPNLTGPRLLFAYAGQAYVMWTRGAGRGAIIAPFVVADSGAVAVDFTRESNCELSTTLPGSVTPPFIFHDRLCFIYDSVGYNGLLDVISVPLASLAGGRQLAGFSSVRALVPNPDHVVYLRFSGVMGGDEVFQLALFSGIPQQNDDDLLRVTAVSKFTPSSGRPPPSPPRH